MESQTFVEENNSLKKRKFGLDELQMMGAPSSSSRLDAALGLPLWPGGPQGPGPFRSARSEMQISRLAELAFPIDMKAICFDHWKNVIFENEPSN
jgi:hypothetical protein